VVWQICLMRIPPETWRGSLATPRLARRRCGGANDRGSVAS
jgi:hypothetical protein